jgi:hypothetical protein
LLELERLPNALGPLNVEFANKPTYKLINAAGREVALGRISPVACGSVGSRGVLGVVVLASAPQRLAQSSG